MAAGMDIRILAGVFITLFGIAVAMAGGDVQSDDIWDQIGSISLDNVHNMFDGSFDGSFDGKFVQGLFPEPEPKPANWSISADLSTADASLSINEPATIRLHINEKTPLVVGSSQISPGGDGEDVTVVLKSFTGSFSTGDTVTLDGEIRQINTDSLSMNYTEPTTLSLDEADIDTLQIVDVRHQMVELTEASGNITTGDSDITLRNESAVFEYFEGEIVVTGVDSGYRYRLDGDLYRGLIEDESSTITIGGENS